MTTPSTLTLFIYLWGGNGLNWPEIGLNWPEIGPKWPVPGYFMIGLNYQWRPVAGENG